MAIPLYDSLNVQHSRNIGDPVAAATTNGAKWTYQQRDFHLNTAINRWIDKMLDTANKLEIAGMDAGKYWDALQGYTASEAQALVANAKALSSWNSANGIVKILSVYDTTLSLPCRYISQRLFDWAGTGGNTLLTASSTNPLWSQIGSTLYVKGAGATDSITLRYVKKHVSIVATSASTAVVSDVAFTATGTAITNFTGTLATHVGGSFVGLDNGGNPFSRLIVAYVSATAFTIASALTADGAGTNGYIVPPNVADIAVPNTYHPQILDLALAVAFKEEGEADKIQLALTLEAGVDKEISIAGA
jgi:hypothetical protein